MHDLSRPGSVLENDPIPSGINEALEHHGCQSYHLDYKYAPPLVKGPCVSCREGIQGAMITAMDVMWHPECFICSHCNSELRPLKYSEKNGKPYCKTCHGMLFLPPCSKCRRDVVAGNYLNIGERNEPIHKSCFKCCECEKLLSETNYYRKEGNFYCEDDFHGLFSPKCEGCRGPIKKDKIKIGLRTWHPEHFTCSVCNIKLTPNNYKEVDNILYCQKDYDNKFLPKCGACGKPITGEVRRAMSQPWHPHCFTCTHCKEQLNPNNFFVKHGLPYCEKDYNALFMPKCAGCTRPITDGRFVQACGKVYHVDHFVCTKCNNVLDPLNYYEVDGKPYCEEDYHLLFSPKCAGCFVPIKDPNNILRAMGKTWHPEHFTCCQCGKWLMSQDFLEKDGNLYCKDDYENLFCSKCAGCRKPIRNGQFVKTMGEFWHPEHFTCSVCKNELNEWNYFVFGGKIFCENDFLELHAPRCCSCKKPVKSKYCITALGSDWHPDCFKCRDCDMKLEDAEFFEISGKPFCAEHYHRRTCTDCAIHEHAKSKLSGIRCNLPYLPPTVSTLSTLGYEDGSRPGSSLSMGSVNTVTSVRSELSPIDWESEILGKNVQKMNNLVGNYKNEQVPVQVPSSVTYTVPTKSAPSTNYFEKKESFKDLEGKTFVNTGVINFDEYYKYGFDGEHSRI